MRCQFGSQEDRRRAIRTTDDTDRTCLGRGKAHEIRTEEGHEDTNLSGCTEDEGLRVRDQRSEIRHGTYANEDEAGIYTGLDTNIEHVEQTSLFEDSAIRVVGRALGIEERRP